MNESKNSYSEELLSFEKSRFEYCVRIFESESKRKEILENKSQFYLSFITIFLGAVFLNIDVLEKLSQLVQAPKNILIIPIYAAMIILAVSILFTLATVLASIRLQPYKDEYPINFISSLFDDETRYLEKKDETSLFKASAMSYAIAVEIRREINNKKAKWISLSSFGVFLSVFSLATFLALITFLSLSSQGVNS